MIFGSRPASAAGARFPALVLAAALFLLTALGLSGCGGGNPTDEDPMPVVTTGTLTGRVIDRNAFPSDVPVGGAVFSYKGRTVSTGVDGRFTLVVDAGSAAQATVVGPARPDGSAFYFNRGFAGGISRLVQTEGFPVPEVAAGATIDLGTIVLYNNDGPPPPPGI